MPKPEGLINYAEEFRPVTQGPSRRCNLVAPNMATTISVLRGVTVIPATYCISGESLGGLEAFAEKYIGINRGDAPCNIVFMFGGELIEALKKLKTNGALVVVGIGQGKPLRDAWMNVRGHGRVILQRFGANTVGRDQTGDYGVGIIEEIRLFDFGIMPVKKGVLNQARIEKAPDFTHTNIYATNEKGEPAKLLQTIQHPKPDGRRGGRMGYGAKA